MREGRERRPSEPATGRRVRADGSEAVYGSASKSGPNIRAASRARGGRSDRGERPDASARPRAPRAAQEEAPRSAAAGRVAAASMTPAPAIKGPPQRIAKLLARAGIASRREIERMIEEKRIAIDGVPVETPATVLASLQGVTVDGNPVRAAEATRLFRYHKPTGLLTAERDPMGRPTIYDRLPRDLPRVVPVGRLDLNTEGLLLLTTDGELKRQLELPSSKIPRTYRARAFGEVSQSQLEDLITGVEIEGMRYGSIDANLERRTGRNAWIEMTLTEGKNREVRRVLEYLGLQVSRLIRVRYGPFHLQDLPVGGVDEVRQHELVQFRKELK
nr:pseudouridine synthase [Sphingomonas deserti]